MLGNLWPELWAEWRNFNPEFMSTFIHYSTDIIGPLVIKNVYWKFKLETIKWSFVKQTVTWILSWIFVMPMPMLDILLSLLYSNTMSACLLVCVLVTYLLWNCWRDMAKLYFLALSWSGVSFWLTKFRIQDPVFPDIRKNPDFRVLFDQFGWNFQVIFT